LYLKRDHGANVSQNFARISQSYSVFRQKWDSYKPCNAEEAQQLESARVFYYRRFLPLRNFKVGFKALGEAIAGRSLEKLRWSMRLFSEGVAGLCGRWDS
jgi:hypothetical protein